MNAAAVFNTPPRTSVLNSVTRKPYDAKQQVSVSRPVESKQVHSSKQINSDSVSQPTYKQSDAGTNTMIVGVRYGVVRWNM